MVGDDAELPCRLSPNANVSAAGAELRWLRERESPAVLVHRAGRAQDAEQMAGYRGRAALVRDGLAQGRVALRIRGVRASDDGEYRCLFKQDDSHGEASVRLQVAGEYGGCLSRDFPAVSVFLRVSSQTFRHPHVPRRSAGVGRVSADGEWEGAGAQSAESLASRRSCRNLFLASPAFSSGF